MLNSGSGNGASTLRLTRVCVCKTQAGVSHYSISSYGGYEYLGLYPKVRLTYSSFFRFPHTTFRLHFE